MKNIIPVSVGLVLLASSALFSADNSASTEKFYGKIAAVNQVQRNITVHNAKQNSDENFVWDSATTVKSNKKAISPMELNKGQSVYVAYVMENDQKKATYIGVRTPFKKVQ